MNVQDIVLATTRAVLEAMRIGNQGAAGGINQNIMPQYNIEVPQHETPKYSGIGELIPFFDEDEDEDVEK